VKTTIEIPDPLFRKVKFRAAERGRSYGIAESRHRKAYESWLDSQLRHFDVLPITDQTTLGLRRTPCSIALRS
jgi:hypothetical protein